MDKEHSFVKTVFHFFVKANIKTLTGLEEIALE